MAKSEEARAAGGSLEELLVELRGRPLAEARALGRDRLPESGSFEARAAALGARLATALAALHAAGVVHGSVRASSILLDGASEVLLGGGSGPGGCERDGGAGAAPAEPRAGAALSAAEDVRALGAVLYELCTLHAPSGAGARGPRAPRRLQPFLSRSAERVLLHALAALPERRPSAAALARDLLAVAAGAPVAAPERERWRRALGILRGRWRALAPG